MEYQKLMVSPRKQLVEIIDKLRSVPPVLRNNLLLATLARLELVFEDFIHTLAFREKVQSEEIERKIKGNFYRKFSIEEKEKELEKTKQVNEQKKSTKNVEQEAVLTVKSRISMNRKSLLMHISSLRDKRMKTFTSAFPKHESTISKIFPYEFV